MVTKYAHYTPIAGHLRIYDDGPGAYNSRVPYELIVTVQWLSSTRVYLSGAEGRITRQIYKSIKEKLSQLGATSAEFEMHGVTVVRQKKPGG